MRTCRMCGEEKPEGEFRMQSDPCHPGNLRRSITCEACRRPSSYAHVNTESGELLCTKCGAWKLPAAFRAASKCHQHRPSIAARQGRDYRCEDCFRQVTRSSDRAHRERRSARKTQLARERGAWYPGCGRPHPRRTYIPLKGDQVYIYGVDPPLKGRIVNDPDVTAYTALIRTAHGVDEYRWQDFGLYERMVLHNREFCNAASRVRSEPNRRGRRAADLSAGDAAA